MAEMTHLPERSGPADVRMGDPVRSHAAVTSGGLTAAAGVAAPECQPLPAGAGRDPLRAARRRSP